MILYCPTQREIPAVFIWVPNLAVGVLFYRIRKGRSDPDTRPHRTLCHAPAPSLGGFFPTRPTARAAVDLTISLYWSPTCPALRDTQLNFLKSSRAPRGYIHSSPHLSQHGEDN